MVWGDAVHFVSVLIRQGHPGPRVPPYRSFEQKMADARAHVIDDGIPWRVLVDDLEGTVHRDYGMLADPTFLIDRDGRVAFYNAITHAPTLHRAICDLMEWGGLGVAGRGFDRRVHAMPIVAAGWPAIRRGLPQSAIELELALPGGAALPFIGAALRPALRPIALRGTPIPRGVRWGAAAALSLAAVAVVLWRRQARLPVNFPVAPETSMSPEIVSPSIEPV